MPCRAVYARVSKGKDWIRKLSCQLSRNPPGHCKKKKNKKKNKNRGLLRTKEETDCSDTNDEFDVNDDLVDKNCTWLAENNLSTFGKEDLCEYPYIASKCPKTCRMCDILDEETGLLEYD
jgi:hypothetical protein